MHRFNMGAAAPGEIQDVTLEVPAVSVDLNKTAVHRKTVSNNTSSKMDRAKT